MDNMKNSDNKKLDANIWIAENFPLKSSYLTNLINSLSSTNEFMGKMKEFFNLENVKYILENKGFPIKTIIPFSFFLNIAVTFGKFKELKSDNEDTNKIFQFPSDFVRISRKSAQDLKTNEKKRFFIANVIL